MVAKETSKETDRKLKTSVKELTQIKERTKKLDNIIQKLYEDKVAGNLSEERFIKLLSTYETE